MSALIADGRHTLKMSPCFQLMLLNTDWRLIVYVVFGESVEKRKSN